MDEITLGEIAQLYRRVCILRAKGSMIEATTLESGELALAVIAAKERYPGSATETIGRTFDRVSDQVETAALVVELLLPEMQKKAPWFSETPAVGKSGPSPSSGKNPLPFDPKPTEPAAIADLIEGMLSQERAEATRNRSVRRAS